MQWSAPLWRAGECQQGIEIEIGFKVRRQRIERFLDAGLIANIGAGGGAEEAAAEVVGGEKTVEVGTHH